MDAILREKEREDKLQSAKKKLKSYRARQQSKSSKGMVPSSPSKRSSVVVVSSSSPSSSSNLPPSPLGATATAAHAARKGGHVHRRSSSRAGSISVIMPHHPAANAAAGQQHSGHGAPSAMHARRNSTRRHSRNISISVSAAATLSAAEGSKPSPASATRAFPTSASSPALSSIAGFASQQQPTSPFSSGLSPSRSFTTSLNRHTGSHPFTATAAPNGRILSPQTSPVLQQGVQQQQQQPVASTSSLAAYRRASLQMPPKSPSSLFDAQPLPPPTTHARRPSRHSRQGSVATRRESMEIMSGLSISSFSFPGDTSPNPNHSATGAFLASSDMSRGNTAASDASAATATMAGGSWAMEERQLSEQDERTMALRALEGTLSTPAETIELPGESDMSTATVSSRESKRASWNGNSAPLTNFGGKGATDLGMLVEEEEEEEEEEEGTAVASKEAQDEVSPIAAASTNNSNSNFASANAKRQRPSSLIFPPSRALPFSGNSAYSFSPSPSSALPSAAEHPVSPTERIPSPAAASRSGPRPLSLSSSASPSTSDAALKSARRQSGLRSLTLTSPEHAFGGAGASSSSLSPAGSPAAPLSATARANKRQSLTLHSGNGHAASFSPSTSANTRPFSISSSSAISPDASTRSASAFQFGRVRRISSTSNGSSALSNSQGPSASPATTATTPAKRQSLSYNAAGPGPKTAPILPSPASTASFASPSNNTSFPRRYSDMSFASSSQAFGFGELVMEQSVAEENEDEEAEADVSGLAGQESILSEMDRADKSDLLTVERPALSRSASSSSNSEDPVILSMQVQALRSQVEHLRGENSSLAEQLAQANTSRRVEVDALRTEMAELRDESSGVEEERDMLREDIDGWRTRCADLERTLREDRVRAEDERKEGMLLREKVRKLGDRLAATQTAGPHGGQQNEDQALAAAQAKLIAEMRDQIFALAAALERERLKAGNANGEAGSRSTSPLLKALASQDANIAASMLDEHHRPATAGTSSTSPRPVAPSAFVGRHHNESAASSNASSYNSSSISSGLGHITEDTSVGDDDSIFGGSYKSPLSPAFSNPNNAYNFTAVSQQQQQPGSGISIHSTSTPLRRDESSHNVGILHTLAEEDEEATEEEEEDDDDYEDIEQREFNDRVPELVPDEFRGRTQSSSTGSADTNDHMPLTPVKESSPVLSAAQQQQQQAQGGHERKSSHERSDSFLRQWSFPSGAVKRTSMEDETRESFWNIYTDRVLPPLPIEPAALDLPPFSAEISLDEDYFSAAFGRQMQGQQRSRPASLLLSQNGPPPSRSSLQASRLSAELAEAPAAVPAPLSAGSRLSQGFSSLWGWKSAVPAAPATAPLPEASPYSPFSSSTTGSSAASALAVPPPVPAKHAAIRTSGARRLLKLEASPLSQLDFTRSCGCEHSGTRVIRL